jgi:quercetin dioxygenase-like cupin family protein
MVSQQQPQQQFRTVFGSLNDYVKGEIEIINDNPKNYAFSNVFDVASKSKPYEKVVVGLNLGYVLEVLRAEGTSPWYAAPHDEFAVVMDGTVEVDLVKLDKPETVAPPDKQGSVLVKGEPVGKKMGWVKLGRGHQVLLPMGSAYRYRSAKPGVILMQTILGDLSVQKWAEICYR